MGVGQAMQGGGSNISLSSAELRFVMLAKSRQGSMRCDAGVGFVLVDSELVSEECTWQQGGRSMKKWEGKGGCVEGRNAIDRVVLEPRHWIAAYQGTPWPTTQFRGEPEIRATHPLQPSSGRRGNQVSNETSKRFSVPGRQIKLLDPGHLFSKDQLGFSRERVVRQEGVGEQNRREAEDEDWGAARRGAIEARRRRQFELAIDLFRVACNG